MYWLQRKEADCPDLIDTANSLPALSPLLWMHTHRVPVRSISRDHCVAIGDMNA